MKKPFHTASIIPNIVFSDKGLPNWLYERQNKANTPFHTKLGLIHLSCQETYAAAYPAPDAAYALRKISRL